MSLSDRLLVIPRWADCRRGGSGKGNGDGDRMFDDGSAATKSAPDMQLVFPVIAVIAAFAVGSVFVAGHRRQPPRNLRAAHRQRASGGPMASATRCSLRRRSSLPDSPSRWRSGQGLLNIGAEGQLYVAAFATAWTGIVLGSLPPVVLIPALHGCRCRRWRRVGRHSRIVEGPFRLARSDQHDHDELHRRRAGELLHAVSLPRSRRSDSAIRADFGKRAHSDGSAR